MENINDLTHTILEAAYKVHSELGPGLLESAYEVCLLYELKKKGLKAVRQVELPLIYDGTNMGAGYKIDILVEDRVIIELKTVKEINDVHIAQTISYLKLSKAEVALLINFNVTSLKKGIKRFVN